MPEIRISIRLDDGTEPQDYLEHLAALEQAAYEFKAVYERLKASNLLDVEAFHAYMQANNRLRDAAVALPDKDEDDPTRDDYPSDLVS